MNKRIKQVWILTIFTAVLVIGAQFYWLYNQYCYSVNEHTTSLIEKIKTLEKEEFEMRYKPTATNENYRMEYKSANSVLSPKICDQYSIMFFDKETDLKQTNKLQDSINRLMDSIKTAYTTKLKEKSDTTQLKSETIDFEIINEAAKRFRLERINPFKKELLDSLLRANHIEANHIDTIRTKSRHWSSTYQKRGLFFNPILKVIYSYNPIEKKNAVFSIPIPLNPIIVEMGWQLLSSILLTTMLTFCLIFQIKTILKQRKIDELRKNFVNTMIHELKRPVQTLKMCIAFLKSQNLVKDEKAMNGIVMDAMFELDNLSAYLSKVKDMTRADYERTPLNIRSFNLRETIEKIIRLNITPPDKEVSIQATFNPDDCLITADPIHIANIINNLIENAIKYSQNRVTINITCNLKNNLLELIVSDNGIGIPSNEQHRVFEKFYRGQTVSNSNIPGIGLGLSYVKLLTEAHKGEVNMKSQVGIGTVFTIKIPQ